MNDITTTDPEKFLSGSNAELFQIILLSTDGHFLYAGGAFSNIEHDGFINGAIVYERRDLVKNYWDAVRFAKSDFGNYPMRKDKVKGRLEIIPIPRFVNPDQE